MSNPVPLMRVYHFADCACYKCDNRRDNKINLPNGSTKTVLAVVHEDINELMPIALQVIRSIPRHRRNTE